MPVTSTIKVHGVWERDVFSLIDIVIGVVHLI
jgi:hypothetical protein